MKRRREDEEVKSCDSHLQLDLVFFASFQGSKVVKVAADWGCHNTKISIVDSNI